MTKSILWFAMCGLVIASCSDSDADPGSGTDDVSKINFISNTTRASINDLTDLQHPTDGGFHVYAANNSSTDWHQSIASEEYKYVSGQWVWANTTPTWPIGGEHYPMTFYAHHPKTATGFTPTGTPPTAVASVASSSLTAAVAIQGTAAAQVDFLGATNSTSTKPPTGKLSVVFDHITSKINFGIITGMDVTAYVNEVDINALVETGTYDYGSKTWDLNAAVAGADYNYFDEVDASDDFTNAATTLNLKSPIYTAGHENHFMLIPQNATPVWDGTATEDADGNAEVVGAYIGMIYRIETAVPLDENAVGYKLRSECAMDTEWPSGGTEHTAYNSATGTYDGPLYVKVGFPLGTAPVTWTKGKGYVYNMKLGTTDATGGLYLSKYYYDENGNNTKILVDGTPDITDPVASGDIHFDVTVDPWEEEPETDL